MIARKKVAPPVTPRIIQANPRRQRVQFALLALAFVLTAWLGYEAGLSRAPGQPPGEPGPGREASQRIAELEQQREALQQQVTELEHSVKQASQALARERARASRPGNTASGKPASPARSKPVAAASHTPPAPKPAAAVTRKAEPVEYRLGLENIRIEPVAGENTYHVSFSVVNDAGNADRLTGTIWIAVNGFANKTPKRLSFRSLSADKRTYVKMGFNGRQDVSERITLPDGFRPKNLLIEAKPYGEKYTGSSMKLDWNASP